MICLHWLPVLTITVGVIFALFALVSSSKVIKQISAQHTMACNTLKDLIEVLDDSDLHPNTQVRIHLALRQFTEVKL